MEVIAKKRIRLPTTIFLFSHLLPAPMPHGEQEGHVSPSKVSTHSDRWPGETTVSLPPASGDVIRRRQMKMKTGGATRHMSMSTSE